MSSLPPPSRTAERKIRWYIRNGFSAPPVFRLSVLLACDIYTTRFPHRDQEWSFVTERARSHSPAACRIHDLRVISFAENHEYHFADLHRRAGKQRVTDRLAGGEEGKETRTERERERERESLELHHSQSLTKMLRRTPAPFHSAEYNTFSTLLRLFFKLPRVVDATINKSSYCTV